MTHKGRESANPLPTLILTAYDSWQHMSHFFFPGDPSTSPSLSQTTPNKDADDQSRKNMTSKNRGKRKADATSSQDSELEVWEETHLSYLLCFFSLLKFIKNVFVAHRDNVDYVMCPLIPEQNKLNWPCKKKNAKRTNYSVYSRREQK